MNGSLFTILLLAGFCAGQLLDVDPAVNLDTPGLIRQAGYPAEAHVAETEDGFLLTMHRIPGPEGSTPVFVQHGLLGSSADWVITGRGKALGFILADLGYDVWMGNMRGNTYSRSHKTIPVTDSRFWDFSFHEVGLYDLPAMISYVTKKKNQSLIYIGHSMGTTAFYVMATQRPDMNSNVRVMFSLAPVAFMRHIKSPIRILAPLANEIELIAQFLGKNEFLPQNRVLRLLAKFGCDLDTLEEEICTNAMFVIFGFDAGEFNMTLLPVILAHTPAGTSTKSLTHFAQEVISDRFRPYDYGMLRNIRIYNSTVPPDYDLSKIEIPIALFYGDNDWLASTADVDRLYQQLPKALGKFRIDYPKFNHLDFMWAIDAPKLVYKKMISMMEKFKK
ncbi:lipase 3-like [Belonocnema kinseyi]|uniref:lipase 3-like n=1 Tax=Belonocnema kinseyi TaxID=2817044 RepID=UPI00143DF0A7|nr:lipase 3-like [Belonocnema kinseyi]XP_033217875.1 lipase 3-like [Belonocnema kinseyi]XP_033217876.1 lipase 3-like [Belonocnema kinseyi]